MKKKLSLTDFDKKMTEEINWLKTEENLDKCKPFQKELERLNRVAKFYSSEICERYQQAEANVVSHQYSRGGESLHRGFYHPSPIIDLVIGNLNRGRLAQNIKFGGAIHYEYGFDNNGSLILVKKFYNNQLSLIECIINEPDVVLGLTFDPEFEINIVCECQYSLDKIINYKKADCYGFDISTSRYEEERYLYDCEGIQSADIYGLENSINLLIHNQYRFSHNKEGFLSNYHVTEFKNENIVPGYLNNQEFKIKVTRKI